MSTNGRLSVQTDSPPLDSAPEDSGEAVPWRPFTWHELRRFNERHTVRIRIGSTRLSGRQRAALGPGTIVSLDNSLDEPIEILVNEEVFGFGHLVVVGGRLAVRISEIRETRQRRSA